MLRGIVTAAVVGLLWTGAARAEDIKAKIKSTDAGKSTVTATVDDKDQTWTVAKDVKVVQLTGKKLKKATLQDVPGGLGALSAGTEVTLTTTKKDDKDVVTQIKVEGLAPKKK
jgi:hypothetical protein